MIKLFKDKKGNWVDIVEYIGTSVGIGIIVVLMGWFLVNFSDSITSIAAGDTLIPNQSVEIAQQAAATFPPAFNYILPIIYIFFVVFSVWSARKIPSSHLLVWIYPIIVLILLFISLVAESAWAQFILDNNFDTVRATFDITNFFLSFLRYFVIFYATVVGWALYAKKE